MIDDWDVIGHPHIRLGSDMYRSAFVSAEAWVISTTTQYPDEARRFVEFCRAGTNGRVHRRAESSRHKPLSPRSISSGSAPKPENMVAFIEAIEYSNLMHNFHPYGPDAWSMINRSSPRWSGVSMPAEAAVPQMAEMEQDAQSVHGSLNSTISLPVKSLQNPAFRKGGVLRRLAITQFQHRHPQSNLGNPPARFNHAHAMDLIDVNEGILQFSD